MKRKFREEGQLFQRVGNAARPYVTVILDRLGVVYRQRGHELQMLNPIRVDHHFGSFSINVRTGCWAEFATGDKGGDVISLVAHAAVTGNDRAAAAQAEVPS